MQFSNLHFGHSLSDVIILTFQGQTLLYCDGLFYYLTNYYYLATLTGYIYFCSDKSIHDASKDSCFAPIMSLLGEAEIGFL